MVRLILFVLPLGLDTFAVSAALGVRGLSRGERLKAALVMSAFEMAMPVVGLFAGRGLGTALGAAADDVAAGGLVALGLWMLVASDDESEKSRALTSRRGLALIWLGIGISLDELAMGFTIGLLHLPLILAIVLIGVQAFAVAQLGLWLGRLVGEAGRELAERAAGVALIGLGISVVVEHATR